MKSFNSINPYTEELLSEFNFTSQNEIDKVLQKSVLAQAEWKKLSFTERVKPLKKLELLLNQKADELAHLASKEIGKVLVQAKAEVLKCTTICDFYSKNAEEILQPTTTTTEKGTVEILFDPMGVVLGIFPWNFPFWQILRSAIPIVVSGNAILVKPAPNVPQCALALQALIEEAGFPAGVIQTIFASETQTQDLIANNLIAATTLTGSEIAGAAVAGAAGKQIKKTVLELGGSDPLIILKDANINEIIAEVSFARFQNNGQSCIASKRFLVDEEIAEEFTEKLIAKTKILKLGNPLTEGTDIGPQARKDLRNTLFDQVKQSVEAGATILYQAKNIPDKGYFFPPTILGNIPANCAAATEELFGPVVGIFTFKDLNEAITLANNTRFGLGASIYTKNIALAKQMATQIQSGMVYINQPVKSDVRFPFGGIKKSGIGSELGSQGLKEFCTIKTVWVK